MCRPRLSRMTRFLPLAAHARAACLGACIRLPQSPAKEFQDRQRNRSPRVKPLRGSSTALQPWWAGTGEESVGESAHVKLPGRSTETFCHRSIQKRLWPVAERTDLFV